MSKTYERYITCHMKFFQQRCIERGYPANDDYECIVKKVGSTWTIDTHHPSYPSISKIKPKKPKIYQQPKVAKGVGTELKKLLAMIGITASPGCSCNARAAKMDSEGIQWCKNNEDLIVDWMGEEAKKRRLPYAKFMGKKILRMAIFRAERNQ